MHLVFCSQVFRIFKSVHILYPHHRASNVHYIRIAFLHWIEKWTTNALNKSVWIYPNIQLVRPYTVHILYITVVRHFCPQGQLDIEYFLNSAAGLYDMYRTLYLVSILRTNILKVLSSEISQSVTPTSHLFKTRNIQRFLSLAHFSLCHLILLPLHLKWYRLHTSLKTPWLSFKMTVFYHLKGLLSHL